jgi:hypothetical protein
MKGPNMPDAISSANSSYYDPSAQFTPADGEGGWPTTIARLNDHRGQADAAT